MKDYNRKEVLVLGAGVAAALLLGDGGRARAHDNLPPEVTNALEHQTYDMFQEWFAWLRNAGVPGYLGEHSVPNSQKPLAASEVEKWLGHFEKVYQLLDYNVDVLPAVTAHVASIYTGGGMGLKIYGPDRGDVPIRDRNFAEAFEQAAVVESHFPPGSLRGMNTSSGAVTQSGFSRSYPGTYGGNYVYPDRADFEYLLSRGHNLTRVPFRWERVQPQLNQPLSSTEGERLKSCLDDAAAVGMQVIPSVQNYGSYAFQSWDYRAIGSNSVPISAYKDLWVRLADGAKDHPAIAGYDIMNEPYDLPGGIPTWEKASQAAVDGIRSRDGNTRIWVAGYHKRPGYYNGLFGFVANHPRAWITGANVGYTSHVYYGPGPGYEMTYDEAVAYWQSQGY